MTTESTLAWSLADIARPLLDRRGRAWTCVQIGSGECHFAIVKLLDLLGRRSAELPADVATELKIWLAGYAGSDEETALRHLVEQIPIVE